MGWPGTDIDLRFAGSRKTTISLFSFFGAAFFFVFWPPKKVRVLRGKGLTSSLHFWDKRLQSARHTMQLFEVMRWQHRFTMTFTLAGSASIPLSLMMKAKSLLKDSFFREFTSFCWSDSSAQTTAQKEDRKIMPRRKEGNSRGKVPLRHLDTQT